MEKSTPTVYMIFFVPERYHGSFYMLEIHWIMVQLMLSSILE